MRPSYESWLARRQEDYDATSQAETDDEDLDDDTATSCDVASERTS